VGLKKGGIEHGAWSMGEIVDFGLRIDEGCKVQGAGCKEKVVSSQ
jgi:hypothetical protein